MLAGSNPHATSENGRVHTLSETAGVLTERLPPLQTIFGENKAYNATDFFAQWQNILSNQPAEGLSFSKTQSQLPGSSVTVERMWDIDSVVLAPKTLGAIRGPNDFQLAFLPSWAGSFSTNQIIEPHGLDLTRARHIQLGAFSAGSVRFAAFVFFPKAARSAPSKTSAAQNTLSLLRQKDFYDRIIIPAVHKTVSIPPQQEIPQSYDIAYAKARSFQEKPGKCLEGR